MMSASESSFVLDVRSELGGQSHPHDGPPVARHKAEVTRRLEEE